jgi:hypothetical protein
VLLSSSTVSSSNRSLLEDVSISVSAGVDIRLWVAAVDDPVAALLAGMEEIEGAASQILALGLKAQLDQ